jgi:hypothetical protein
MTPHTMPAANGQAPSADKGKPTRAHKPAKRKAPTASRAAAKGAAKRRTNGQQAAARYSATASRLMARGKQAIGGAYEWAAEGAGRAMPIAARRLPDRQTLQSLLEERPFVLGAIGLGLGAVIGMMLPGRVMRGYSSPARSRKGRSARRR